MRGATTRIRLNAPVRLTASTAAQSASLIFAMERSRVMPALFTSRLGGAGNSATALSTARASAISRRTRRCWNSPARSGSQTSKTSTCAPAAASASAIARPMPRLAPVTIARRPEKSKRGCLSGCGFESMFEAKLLRGAEAAVIEEGEKIPFAPVDLRPDVLHPKRHQIDQQLRQQRPADAEIPVVRIDTDRIHNRGRLDPTELAEVDARHDEADHSAIALGNQGHPHV